MVLVPIQSPVSVEERFTSESSATRNGTALPLKASVSTAVFGTVPVALYLNVPFTLPHVAPAAPLHVTVALTVKVELRGTDWEAGVPFSATARDGSAVPVRLRLS